MDQRRAWAARIMHEASLYLWNSFGTFTYSDDKYPAEGLNKKHLQDFWKRLRKQISPRKIRYFAAGEYGDKSGRAHYHAIIFNYWPKDAKHYKDTDYGALYNSDSLANCWGHGHVVVAKVEYKSASYVASYTTKKLVKSSRPDDKTTEFACCSRRPGIGADWFQKYGQETIRDDYIIANDQKMRPPRYYDALAKRLFPEQWEQNHETRLQRASEMLRPDKLERLKAAEKINAIKNSQYEKLDFLGL